MHSGRKGCGPAGNRSRHSSVIRLSPPARVRRRSLEVCRRLDGQRSSSCLNEVPQRLDRLSKSADIAAAAATSRLAQSDCGSAITASGVPDSTMLPRFITSISSQKDCMSSKLWLMKRTLSPDSRRRSFKSVMI